MNHIKYEEVNVDEYVINKTMHIPHTIERYLQSAVIDADPAPTNLINTDISKTLTANDTALQLSLLNDC